MPRGVRSLLVVADDLGIGPATSRAIVELASAGVVTGTVLLVNSPHAEHAVNLWAKAAPRADLGWHPCLTMDPPVAPPGEVPSLVGPDGNLWPLRQFVPRVLAGRVRRAEVERELLAQWRRFVALTGRYPALVNTHQHAGLFGPVGATLREILRGQPRRPFLRVVTEPVSTLLRVPGSKFKRAALSLLGRRARRAQRREGFAAADWLAGITDPPWVRRPDFFALWLAAVPGRVVELMCHPGEYDPTLIGRDCSATDGYLERRVDELALLRKPDFLACCARAGFRLTLPSELTGEARVRHVA
jgi:predicted glycoside hydrolase/deacetylase ChbG (UPF0249 family)